MKGARDPFRDITKDPKREELLRKKVFAVATPGVVEFDDLLDKVLMFSPGAWVRDVEDNQKEASA